MIINELMKNKKLTRYRLSKDSGIAYTTIDDICSGKARLEKCSAETIYRLAKELKITMEELLEPYMIKKVDFELYKSNVCHRVKTSGDINFIIDTLESDDIHKYYAKKWYPESLYLLAMLDYLSNENDVPLCSEYNDLRSCRLAETIYPAGILTEAAVMHDESVKERSIANAIPEFLRFNIVESEVRNVL